jgi:hypothetical protein
MMGDLIRALTEEGIHSFREYLAQIRAGLTEEPPWELLSDPRSSAKFNPNVEIENLKFATGLDAAKYFYEVLSPVDYSRVDQNIGLWSWLSLKYINQLSPIRKNGLRRPGQDYRFILEPEFRYYYRHLLFGAYTVFRLHSSKVPLLFDGPPSEINKFRLELACRQGFITNKGIIEAANLLYYDVQKGTAKPGAAATTRKPGTLFRFIDVVQQLDLTYDLHSMTGEQVLNLLPKEFDEWRKP